MHKHIHQIDEKRQALYVGFFGPIGVSAIFYLYITLDFLRKNIRVDEEIRPDAEYLIKVVNIVVWFLVICSVVNLARSLNLPRLITTGHTWSDNSHVQTRNLATTIDLSSHLLATRRQSRAFPCQRQRRRRDRRYRRGSSTSSRRKFQYSLRSPSTRASHWEECHTFESTFSATLKSTLARANPIVWRAYVTYVSCTGRQKG
jgi:hypothetical protein